MSFVSRRFNRVVVVGVVALFVCPGCQKKRVTLNASPIEFYDARTVVTETATYREYKEDGANTNADGVSFVHHPDGNKVAPGSSDYAEMVKGWELITGPESVESVTLDPGKKQDYPLVKFNQDGADKWERWSRANNHRGEKVAVVVNGRVLTIVALPEGSVVGGEIQVPVSPKVISR